MMRTKKLREIALLTVPIVAIAAIVPGVRLLGEWREANKVPRIESLELRAPTPLENYLGADAGLRARLVAPETKNSDSFMELRMEIRDDSGRRWNSQNKNWAQITRSGRVDFPIQGSSKLWIAQSGLCWNKIAGNGKTARVNVAFEQQRLGNFQVLAHTARQFTLTNDLPPAPLVARRNFLIERIDVVSVTALRGIESELEHRFTLTLRRLSAAPPSDLTSSWTNDWQLKPVKGAGSFQMGFVALTENRAQFGEPVGDENSLQLQLSLLEDSKLRGRPARLNGVLSIDQGWPQLIVIELPQGLPEKLPYQQVGLPFVATLAPLPK